MVTSLMSVKLSDLVVKRRGVTILGPIDLELESEGFTVVLGPNGAGKTTLLKVLHGVERVTRGSVDWSVPAEVAREAQSYVFQNPIMLRRTVAQNLAYPLKVHGVDKATVDLLIREWAERIGLADAMDRPAPRLSGGEKQKLALGRALIRKPKVLFLDEPCANLDGRATRDIEDLLLQANKDGTRIIMTTHDLGQCRRLGRDVVFLLNGKVHEFGAAEHFMASPSTLEARLFLKGDILV